MMSDVDIAREGPVLTIEFSRPDKSNPMTADAVERILEAMTGKESSDLALMVFRGQGRNFCSGFDLTGLEAATDADLLFRILRVETLLQAVFHAPFLTLALAHGNVVGAGADLFCACALRIATPETTFRMPGLKFGVALGTRRLRHRVGTDAARDFLLPPRRIDADHALGVGFLQRIVPKADWPVVLQEAIASATTLPPAAMADVLSISGSDTRSEDMADLVRTAGRPGLQNRILEYRNAVLSSRAERRGAI